MNVEIKLKQLYNAKFNKSAKIKNKIKSLRRI